MACVLKKNAYFSELTKLYHPSYLLKRLMGKARSPVAKLKAPAPARSILLQLDMSRRNVHPRMPDFNELAARIHALKNDMSCLLPLYINKIVVVSIDEILFVQFSSSAFYPPCCLEKPLKAPKMQKKEYDETDLDNLKKNKENEKALKELKDKAAPSTLGCAGLKKSSKGNIKKRYLAATYLST